MGVVSLVKTVYPLILLGAALARFNLLSAGYLLFFFLFHLFPPIKQVVSAGIPHIIETQSLSEHGMQALLAREDTGVVHRRWDLNRFYFVMVLTFSLLACLGHAVFQVLLVSTGTESSHLLEVIGFHSFSGGQDATRALVPDLAVFLLTLLFFIVTLKLYRREQVAVDRATVHALRFLSYLFLFVAGVTSPSVFCLFFFSIFTLFLFFWASFPLQFKSEERRFTLAYPILLVVVAHLSLQYMFQFEFFQSNLSDSAQGYLGLYHPDSLSREHLACFVGTLAEVFLLMFLAEYSRVKNAVVRTHALQAQRSVDSKPNPFRYFVVRLLRRRGRAVCAAALLAAALTVPSYLTLGYLALAISTAILTAPAFVTLCPLMLLYTVGTLLAQYTFAIPSLMPTSLTLDQLGLGKHRPTPVMYLLVTYFPILCLAGYCRLMKTLEEELTPSMVASAAAVGDVELLERTRRSKSHLIRDTRRNGATLLHISAREGQSSAVKELLKELNPGMVDEDGNTALHLAFLNGHDTTVQVLLDDERTNAAATNSDGVVYTELKPSSFTKLCRGFRKFAHILEATFYRHAEKLSLIVLYIVGMEKVNYFHLAFLVFFVVFFSVPSLARKLWGILVLYTGSVLLALFCWSVFLHDSRDERDSEQWEWANVMGFFKATNMWKSFFLYYLTLIVTAFQLQLFRKRDAMNVEALEQRLKSGDMFESPAINAILAAFTGLFAWCGLVICYAMLSGVALIDVSVFNLGYLVLFIFALFIHALLPPATLKPYWIVVVAYTAIVLILKYAYQFSTIRSTIQHGYPKSWDAHISIEDWGFKEYVSGNLILHLLAPTATFVAVVFQLRAMWMKRGDHYEELEEEEGAHKKSMLTDAYAAIVAGSKRLLFLHADKLAVMFTWISCACITGANVMNGAYILVILFQFNRSRVRAVWVPLAFLSFVLLLSRYVYQFPHVMATDSNRVRRARWWGYEDHHKNLYRYLVGDLLIYVLAILLRVARRFWGPDRLAGRASVVPLEPEEEEKKEDTEETQAVKHSWWAELKLFFKIVIRRMHHVLANLMSDTGLQLCVFALLLLSFARCNVLSVVYVVAICGYYIFSGRRAISSVWPMVVIFQSLMILAQFAILVGPPPFKSFRWPWRHLSVRDQRWLLVGEYRASDVTWDFVAFFFCALQTAHFRQEAEQERALMVRGGMGFGDERGLYRQRTRLFMEGEGSLSDPTAWYNTAWSTLRSWAYIAMDKVLLLLIFFVGSFHADLLSLGYVVLAILVLIRQDLYAGDPLGEGVFNTHFKQYMRAWRRIHHYNYFVLFVVIVYQVPYMPGVLRHSPRVTWENVIGLHQYAIGNSNGSIYRSAFSATGSLHSIFIFLFVDAFLQICKSPHYFSVLQYYERNRQESESRGRESALLRKQDRMEHLAEIRARRQQFRHKLRQIQLRMQQISQESLGEDPFVDEQVWPNWFREEPPFEGLQHLDVGEEKSEEDEEEGKFEGKLEKEKDVEEEEEEEEGSKFVKVFRSVMNWLREGLLAGIDPTLWHSRDKDEEEELEAQPLYILFHRYILSHTEFVVFCLYWFNVMINPSLLTLVVPVAIFAYALLQAPRAPKGFWLFCLSYSTFLVLIKFLWQLPIFCFNGDTNQFSLRPSPYCVLLTTGFTADHELSPGARFVRWTRCNEWADFVLGMHKSDNFVRYVFWNLACMVGVVLHRTLLVSKGVWEEDEETLGDPILQKHARYRETKTPTRRLTMVRRRRELMKQAEEEAQEEKKVVEKPGKEEEEEEESFIQYEEDQPVEKVLLKIWSKCPQALKDYYFTLIPREQVSLTHPTTLIIAQSNIHLVKPGRDYYLWIFLLELCCAIYILLFYAAMASTTFRSISSSLTANMFQGKMVITLLVQILFVILDRTFYLFRSLRWKIALQYTTVLYWCLNIFIYWPAASQVPFNDNSTTQFFFLMKLGYFVLSGMQVRAGYPPIERTGFQYLTRSASYNRELAFKVYRAIPFVFELRSLLDWVTRESSLDLWESLKLEDIYANIFIVQCELTWYREHPRGEVQPLYRRLVQGLLVFILLVFILVFPLILFSSANPVSTTNNVEGVRLQLSVFAAQHGEFGLVEISTSRSMGVVDRATFAQMKMDRLLGDDKQGSVQKIVMSGSADDVWVISPPGLNDLSAALQDKKTNMKVRVTMSFLRPGPAEEKSIDFTAQVDISSATQLALSNLINGSSEAPVQIANAFPQYVRLPPTGVPTSLSAKQVSVWLSLTRDESGATLLEVASHVASEVSLQEKTKAGSFSPPYWSMAKSDKDKKQGIEFVTVSNPIWKNPLGFSGFAYSVIGIYSIVVLTIGRFVRMAFGDYLYQVPFYDLQNVDDLVLFCEAIYIARLAGMHFAEEKLYRRLVKIFRTPRLLVHITARKEHED